MSWDNSELVLRITSVSFVFIRMMHLGACGKEDFCFTFMFKCDTVSKKLNDERTRADYESFSAVLLMFHFSSTTMTPMTNVLVDGGLRNVTTTTFTHSATTSRMRTTFTHRQHKTICRRQQQQQQHQGQLMHTIATTTTNGNRQSQLHCTTTVSNNHGKRKQLQQH